MFSNTTTYTWTVNAHFQAPLHISQLISTIFDQFYPVLVVFKR